MHLRARVPNQGRGDCGGEEIVLALGSHSGEVDLSKLTEEGTPASARARLLSATCKEPGFSMPFVKGLIASAGVTSSSTIALKAPANLPLHFGDINLGTKEKPAAGPPSATWKIVGDWPAFYALLAQVTEKDARSAGRSIQSLRFILTYKNRKGQPVGTETIALNLTSKQGTVVLKSTGPLDQLGSIAIMPLTVEWQERVVRVPLGD
jgi:hypothetical protein